MWLLRRCTSAILIAVSAVSCIFLLLGYNVQRGNAKFKFLQREPLQRQVAGHFIAQDDNLQKFNASISNISFQTKINIKATSPWDFPNKKLTANQVETPDAFSLKQTNPDRIMYNRIPKSGSTGIKYFFKKLSRKNGWSLISSEIFDRKVLNYSMQAALAKEVMSKRPGMVYERHVHWINFTLFSLEMPVYINVVRDPFERLVSDYYFLRVHLRHLFPQAFISNKHLVNETFDDCVSKQRRDCTEDTYRGYFKIIPFFCGQQKECRQDSDFALGRAKENVLKYYSVVGYTEDLQGFFNVLEAKFPTYFAGLPEIYHKYGEYAAQRYKTKKKTPPNNSTKAIMIEKLHREYDFYYFIKQRFQNTLHLVNQSANRPK